MGGRNEAVLLRLICRRGWPGCAEAETPPPLAWRWIVRQPASALLASRHRTWLTGEGEQADFGTAGYSIHLLALVRGLQQSGCEGHGSGRGGRCERDLTCRRANSWRELVEILTKRPHVL